MVTIKNLDKIEKEKPCRELLTCSVINKEAATRYGNDRIMMNVWLADSDTFTKAVVYDPSKMAELLEEESYMITNFINKTGCIIINKPTTLFRTAKLIIPETVKSLSGQPVSVNVQTVSESCLSPKKPNIQEVTGIVTKVSPPQIKRVRATGEEIPLVRLKIRDPTGDIDVCLWRQMAGQKVHQGELVRLRNFSVTDVLDAGKSAPALTNRDSSSTLETLPADEKYTALLTESDFTTDDSEQFPVGTVVGVAALKTYRSCLNDACFRKQLKDNKCPSCNMTYAENSAGKSSLCSLLLQTNNNNEQYTLFTQQLQELKNQLEIESEVTSQAFAQNLQTFLPFKIQYEPHGNKISKIKVIPHC